jgi:predicted nucleic acid-binding protein
VIICDTGGLVAAYDRQEADGPALRELLDAEAGTLIVSPFVLAELDYMLMSRAGVQAELTLLQDLADEVYQVASFTAWDAEHVEQLARRHADLKLGLAHAHTMVLAAPERYGTTRVLTLDHKHFRAVKPLQGGTFTVLPADL